MKRWSTKDLQVLRPAAPGVPGDGLFTFTDRYSVYDFGVMPEEIPGKGTASCAMAVKSFQLLAAGGVATHFVEQIADDTIRIRLLDVDVTGRSTGPGSLIPLQVIYRNALPAESSVHRRVAAGELAPEAVPPFAAERPWLSRAMIEFTTKFEEVDRFVSRDEASEVASIPGAGLDRIEERTRRVDEILSAHSDRVGLALLDGKAEYGLDADGEIMLVDHAGTPDENRFYVDGMPACKELLRLVHPDLRRIVRQAVSAGIARDQWPRPSRLELAVVAAVAQVYRSLAAAWVGAAADATAGLSGALRDFFTVAELAAPAEGVASRPSGSFLALLGTGGQPRSRNQGWS